MAISYYASRISPNLYKDPKTGFLIAPGCVIARTGWQSYNVRDLPQDLAEEYGIDITNPTAQVNVYRTPEEVFSSRTIASFEGKPITDNHPRGFVDINNIRQYQCGHIQNVRKGEDNSLESGDTPLIADLIITDPQLISKVENNVVRELSCGYDFSIAKDGDRILQINLIGNHTAVVPKGRAGSEARINDADTLVAEEQQIAGNPPKTEKEKSMKGNFWTRLFRLAAADEQTTDDELAQIGRRAFAKDGEDPEDKKEKSEKAEDRKAAEDMKKTAEDAKKMAEDAKKTADDAKKMADDAKRKHHGRGGWNHDSACAPGEAGHEKCTEDKCMAMDKSRGKDSGHRARMQDAFERFMDKMNVPKEEEEGAAEDTDMKELMKLFEQFLGEEGKESEHTGDDADMIEPVGETPQEEEEETMVPANDSLVILEPVIAKTKDKNVIKAFDSAPIDDEFEFLKAIRPAVAKTTDTRVRRAFDSALQKFTRVSRASDGGYHHVIGAQRTTSRARDAAIDEKQDQLDKLVAAYGGYYKGDNKVKV